jgi:hypothetical protein
MRAGIRIGALVFMTLVLAAGAQAGWFIFGKSEGRLKADCLYVNDIAFDEKDAQITLYAIALKDQTVKIRGRAVTKGADVKSVQVSLDGGFKWEDAKLLDDGAFEYTFTAKANVVYQFRVRTADSAGKQTGLDIYSKAIVLSDKDAMDVVREVADKLIEAYEGERTKDFMACVSERFAGDDTTLDRALRRDFSMFDQMDLKYAITSIASGPKGRLHATIFYERLVIATSTGVTYSDSGTTELAFEMGDNGPLLYSMKKPVLFGVSDQDEVATGAVILGMNSKVLQVLENGTIQLGPVTGT